MAMLIFVDGPAKDRKFALSGHRVVMVGRDAICTVQVVDPELSRCHLQIAADDDGGHTAIDYESRNGVIINGAKIEDKTELSDGDQIVVGASTIVYTTNDSADAATVSQQAKFLGQGHLHTTTQD